MPPKPLARESLNHHTSRRLLKKISICSSARSTLSCSKPLWKKNLKKYSNPAILVTPRSTKLFLTPVTFNYEATGGWIHKRSNYFQSGKSIPLRLPFHIPFFIAPPDRLPLVVLGLSPGKGQRHLGLSIPEINPQRNHGITFFIDLSEQSFNFILMQKEFPGTQGIVVFIVGKGISPDVHLIDKHFTPLDPGIRILQVHPAHPKGFDFGTQERHSGLVFILYEIIVPGLPVFRDDLPVFRLQIGSSPASIKALSPGQRGLKINVSAEPKTNPFTVMLPIGSKQKKQESFLFGPNRRSCTID